MKRLQMRDMIRRCRIPANLDTAHQLLCSEIPQRYDNMLSYLDRTHADFRDTASIRDLKDRYREYDWTRMQVGDKAESSLLFKELLGDKTDKVPFTSVELLSKAAFEFYQAPRKGALEGSDREAAEAELQRLCIEFLNERMVSRFLMSHYLMADDQFTLGDAEWSQGANPQLATLSAGVGAQEMFRRRNEYTGAVKNHIHVKSQVLRLACTFEKIHRDRTFPSTVPPRASTMPLPSGATPSTIFERPTLDGTSSSGDKLSQRHLMKSGVGADRAPSDSNGNARLFNRLFEHEKSSAAAAAADGMTIGGVHFDFSGVPDDLYVSYPQQMFDYCLRELLKNAWVACQDTAKERDGEPPGKIYIEAWDACHSNNHNNKNDETFGAGKRVVNLSGRHTTIRIRDTGVGIPQHKMEKIWHLFYSKDGYSSQKGGKTRLFGYGIGLPMARLYARALEGDVEIESEAWRGTVATFKMPADLLHAECLPQKVISISGDGDRVNVPPAGPVE